MDADIGIIGGSGFYSLLDGAESIDVDTKYGRPSGRISIGTVGGRRVAFIPRHGTKHTIPPHKVPYRANVDALSSLGVKRIIATGASGSLKQEYGIGQIVLFDQFVNMTHGRDDTFFDQDEVAHVSTADPYCPELRARASQTAKRLGIEHKNGGSVVVINGPRFSTKAESMFFSNQGFDTINMTQYPEAALAREKAICYLGVGIVTDYDAGVIAKGGIAPVKYDEVLRIFAQNVDRVKNLVKETVRELPKERKCDCGSALDGAKISA